jgi:hypothetical protein
VPWRNGGTEQLAWIAKPPFKIQTIVEGFGLDRDRGHSLQAITRTAKPDKAAARCTTRQDLRRVVVSAGLSHTNRQIVVTHERFRPLANVQVAAGLPWLNLRSVRLKSLF